MIVQPRPLARSSSSARCFIRKSSIGWSAAAWHTESKMKCSTPAPFAARIRFAFPCQSTVRGLTSLAGPKPVIAETTVRAPATACSRVRGSVTSPVNVSTLGPTSDRALSGFRVRIRTSSPRSPNRSRSRVPMVPLPPATRIIAGARTGREPGRVLRSIRLPPPGGWSRQRRRRRPGRARDRSEPTPPRFLRLRRSRRPA
jgi:hypothetical protein